MKDKAKLLAGLAEVFETKLTDSRLSAYLGILKSVTAEELEKAIGVIMTNPKILRFPLPAQILEVIRPQENIDAEANETANRIMQAIADFGYSRPEEARKFIGELGWLVVTRQGGWVVVCESTRPNDGMLKAQWRELAKALYHRSKMGTLEIAPGLPKTGETSLQYKEPIPIGKLLQLGRDHESK